MCWCVQFLCINSYSIDILRFLIILYITVFLFSLYFPVRLVGRVAQSWARIIHACMHAENIIHKFFYAGMRNLYFHLCNDIEFQIKLNCMWIYYKKRVVLTPGATCMTVFTFYMKTSFSQNLYRPQIFYFGPLKVDPISFADQPLLELPMQFHIKSYYMGRSGYHTCTPSHLHYPSLCS